MKVHVDKRRFILGLTAIVTSDGLPPKSNVSLVLGADSTDDSTSGSSLLVLVIIGAAILPRPRVPFLPSGDLRNSSANRTMGASFVSVRMGARRSGGTLMLLAVLGLGGPDGFRDLGL